MRLQKQPPSREAQQDATLSMDKKAVAFTKMLPRVPPVQKTLATMVIASSISGLLLHLLYYSSPLAEAFAYGVEEGFALLFAPAIIAAVLSATLSDRRQFKKNLRNHALVSSWAMLLTSLFYFLAVLSTRKFLPLPYHQELLLVGNGLVLVLWFAASIVVFNSKIPKALFSSTFHPLLNLSFLVVFGTVFEIERSLLPLIIIKLFFASAVLLLALWAVFALVNAPARRNFGISTVQSAAFFTAQWLAGSKALEELMDEMGEEVNTLCNFVAFKSATNPSKIKSVFVSPYLHYGPLGNLGGSEFPAIISKKLDERFNSVSLVFHSTVNHDFNPVSSTKATEIADEITKAIRSSKPSFSNKAFFAQARGSKAQALGFGFGENIFLSLSMAPFDTEDIDFGTGMLLRERLLSQGFKDACVVDRHNSTSTRKIFDVGSDEFLDYYDTLGKLKPESGKSSSLKFGVAKSPKNFPLTEGIGGAGIRAAVFEISGKRACIALVDANNLQPEFREEILGDLKKFKFDFVDVFTTDSHSVNAVGGIHNRLGERCDKREVTKEIVSTVEAALGNLEPCVASFQTFRFKAKVLGVKRTSELITTFNSIVAVLRIIAPAVMLGAVGAALFLLTKIK